jgi:hypothetical protein
MSTTSITSGKQQRIFPRRSCNGCTKCCEGWLEAEIEGEKMYPGKPCQFKGENGCTAYENRPEDPCRVYSCYWLEDPQYVPEEFWPMNSNTIMTRRWHNDIPYLEFTEAGGKLPVEMLDWAIQSVQLGFIKNIVYKLNGNDRFITSNEKFAHEVMGTIANKQAEQEQK